MARLFGTDGVRGVANSGLTPELAMAIGRAAVATRKDYENKRMKILIGKDTRVSSDMLENALAAGICSAGADVLLLGFIPTPALAYLVREYGADAGVMITASHNPMEFNGIKIINGDGYKLPDAAEDEIEEYINKGDTPEKRGTGRKVGSVSYSKSAVDDYVGHLYDLVGCDLSGLKVAMDCANGAACETAQKLFGRLGADVVFTAVSPDGFNINDRVGSTHLESIKDLTVKTGADIGIAFDGDADRCLAVDENGEEIDGDVIIGMFAKYLKKKGKLARDPTAVTIMSNLGLEVFCRNNGITMVRTAVGDRYVLEEMLKEGYSLGGEQSGHVILSEYATTGDGQLTAVFLLRILKESGSKASGLAGEIPRYPQIHASVGADADQKAAFDADAGIKDYIKELELSLGGDYRMVVRVSGTEPIIRVMAEGKELSKVEETVLGISNKIRERI